MDDELKEKLKDLRKQMEKALIRSTIATQSKVTSQVKKQQVTQLEKAKLASLKNSASSYSISFKASAKGKWVTQAQQAFTQTSEQLQ